MMDLDTSQKSPIRYDTFQALKNVSRFDTDPQKVYLDTRYVSNISILCTTGLTWTWKTKPCKVANSKPLKKLLPAACM